MNTGSSCSLPLSPSLSLSFTLTLNYSLVSLLSSGSLLDIRMKWPRVFTVQQSAECVCVPQLAFIISRVIGLNLIMSCYDFCADWFGTGHQHARPMTRSRGAERHIILCSVSQLQRARASSPLHPSPGVAPCYSHIINSRALSAVFAHSCFLY